MRVFIIFFCIITTTWANPILKLKHSSFKAKACCGQGGATIHHSSHAIHSIGEAQVPASYAHGSSGIISTTGNIYNPPAYPSGVQSGHLVQAGAGNSAIVHNHFTTETRPILNYGNTHANTQVQNVAVAGAGAGAVVAPSNLAFIQGSGASYGNAHSNTQVQNVAVAGAGVGAETVVAPSNLALIQGGGSSYGASYGQSASGWNTNGAHYNNYNAFAPSSSIGGAFGNSAAAASAASSAASSWNQQNLGQRETNSGAFSQSSSASWSSSRA